MATRNFPMIWERVFESIFLAVDMKFYVILAGDTLHFFMHEIKAHLEELRGLIDIGLKKVDLPSKKAELEKLNLEMQNPNFWNDRENAQEVSQKASNIKKLIETWEKMTGECDELIALLPDISPEHDQKGADEYKQMVSKL